MPSPFPGMDPYLEGSLWMSVHTDLAVAIAHELNRQLLPRYIALTARRYVLDAPDEAEVSIGAVYPDVGVLGPKPIEGRERDTATIVPPLQMATLIRVPIPHITVEIRDVAKRQLVTVIEIFSPTNKKGEGFREYCDRREMILRSTAHLIEIDLLRKGRRVPMRGKLPPVSYFVLVCRREQRLATGVWPIALNRSLPVIPVPLREGDIDAKMDLQQTLTSVYDEGGLRYLIDYTKPPEVPLGSKQSAWVDRHLRAAGLRS
jgi:Protein of unknown function (DUF4058)